MAAIALSLVSVVGVLPAGAATYRASLADVSATLTYQGTYPMAHHATLIISRAGHVAYRAPVSASFCGQDCWPTSAWGPQIGSPVRVVTLRPGAPDVVLGLYSGGAHCCYIVEVFAPSATTYTKFQIELGDPIARIQVLPGNRFPALLTQDDTFAYAFTDYAASGLPIKVLRFTGSGFANVTRQYPALIRADASQWLSAFYDQASSHSSDSVGVIAAWAADEYLLGRMGAADQFLIQQARAGHLNGALSSSTTGAAFAEQIEKFLVQQGY